MSEEAAPAPYRITAIFDEMSLPQALRSEHRVKPGAWGVIRVLEGALRYVLIDTREEELLTPERPGLVEPGRLHFVEPLGPMRMRIEFYDREPRL